MHSKYCILKGYPDAYDDVDDDNHIYIHVMADNQEFSVAVNVASNQEPSNMFYCLKTYSISDMQLNHRFADWLKLSEGIHFHKRDGLSESFVLDYEDAAYQLDSFSMADYIGSPRNELGLLLEELLNEVMADPEAMTYVFGKAWGPKDEQEHTFFFRPARGVHDVHGNASLDNCKEDVSFLPDGAIFFSLPQKQGMVGLFCKFL